jgi:hypothetical protein
MTPAGKITLLGYIIWVASDCMAALILYRGFRARLLTRYPLFYAQIALGLGADIIGYPFYTTGLGVYRRWYWATEFLTDFVQCAMILEILRYVLPTRRSSNWSVGIIWIAFYAEMLYLAIVYTFMTTFLVCVVITEIARYVRSGPRNVEKVARLVRVATVGAIICCALAYMMMTTEPARASATYARLEKDFTAVEVLLFLAVLVEVLYYRIPMGRNLKGIFLGFGCMVGLYLPIVTTVGYGRFSLLISILQQLSGTIPLIIWLLTLWNYHPNLPLPAAGRLDASPLPAPRQRWKPPSRLTRFFPQRAP